MSDKKMTKYKHESLCLDKKNYFWPAIFFIATGACIIKKGDQQFSQLTHRLPGDGGVFTQCRPVHVDHPGN